jgi:hypothetical protein
MFENEILRLLEMRTEARGNAALVARIDQALVRLSALLQDGAPEQFAALDVELEALEGELARWLAGRP